MGDAVQTTQHRIMPGDFEAAATTLYYASALPITSKERAEQMVRVADLLRAIEAAGHVNVIAMREG